MEKEDIIENEEVKKEEGLVIKDFSSISKKTNTTCDIYTNITDNKKIFNLESHVDNLINDFENSTIEVKEILIKRYAKPMKEPIIDEETGEVLKDMEYSMSCIVIDTNDVSYATGSKTFTIQMMRYLEMFGLKEPVLIKIVKNKRADSNNKTLGFELV